MNNHSSDELTRANHSPLSIPRVIYQTHRSSELPDEIQRSRDELLRRNPGWNYEFFDNKAAEKFILDEYGPAMLDAYEAISPAYGATRADLFRYLLIYRRGGVYLDVKSSVSKPLDEVAELAGSYLLTTWGKAEQTQGWGDHTELRKAGLPEYQQWHVIASPQHRYLQKVIERVLRNIRRYVPEIHGVGHNGGIRLTGPIPYTLTIASLRDPTEPVLTDKQAGLVYSVLPSAKDHRSALQTRHYSTVQDPVARVSTTRRLIGRGFVSARSVYRAAAMVRAPGGM